MDNSFWQKQDTDRPLFPDFEWQKPENKRLAGNVLIIGGNQHGFAAVAMNYQAALDAGAGSVRTLLPDALEKIVKEKLPDTLFLPSNISGGFSREGLEQALAAVEWAESVVLIGDTGQNSETGLLLEKILMESDKPITITRDAVDLLKNTGEPLMNRPNTTLVVSFGQLQKLFQSVYYPKVLTFSQNLAQTVENLHKFTLTYPVTIELFHKDMLIAAHASEVISQQFSNPTLVWSGKLATKSAVYQMWGNNPLEAIASSWL
jgi:NAD(P)H-hydrate repair Nnr-like enzyme with NAD(P)H-hydrate dehydratase domain